MKRVLLISLLGLVLLSLESGFLAATGIRFFGGALMIGLLLHLGVRAGAIDGAVAACAIGCLWDCFAGTPPGLSMVSALAVFLFVRFATQAVDAVPGVVVLLAVIAQGIRFVTVSLLIWASPSESAGDWLGFFLAFGAETLVAAMLAPPVYSLARALDRFFCGDASEAGELWLT